MVICFKVLDSPLIWAFYNIKTYVINTSRRHQHLAVIVKGVAKVIEAAGAASEVEAVEAAPVRVYMIIGLGPHSLLTDCFYFQVQVLSI